MELPPVVYASDMITTPVDAKPKSAVNGLVVPAAIPAEAVLCNPGSRQ